MFNLIKRQLLHDAGRTVFVSLAIAATLALVLILEGFQQGLFTQLRHVVLNRDADLIVTQTGVANFVASRSVLPQMSREQIEAIDGVIEAHPMTLVPVIYEKHGRKTPIFFAVYDTAGGPVNIIEGGPISESKEIIIDKSLAKIHQLNIGDTFIVADYEFKIVGITQQAAAMFTSFSFITYDDLIDFYFNSDLMGDITSLPLVSFFLLQLDPSADRNRVARNIEQAVPEIDVFFPENLASNDENLGRTLFGPVMQALIGVSYLICLFVIGIILFAAIYSRRRSLGVLKALGFSNRSLGVAVVWEGLILLIIAIPVSLVLATFAAWMIETRAPLYFLNITEPWSLARTFFAALVLTIVGALLPVRLLARIDPAIVFRT